VDRDGRVLATTGLAGFLGGAPLPDRVELPLAHSGASRSQRGATFEET